MGQTMAVLISHYTHDMKVVYGDDSTSETFRVLKDKEIKAFGEFRMRRLVLEARDGIVGEEEK